MNRQGRYMLKAFTIVDVVISMIIAVIIVGIVYVMFFKLKNQLSFTSVINANNTTILRLKAALDADIENAELVKSISPTTFAFVTKGDTVYYYYGQVVIRSKSLLVDTFLVKTDINFVKHTMFNGYDSVIRQIGLVLETQNSSIDYLITKKYSCEELIKIH